MDGDDCLRTIDIFRKLGVAIECNGTNVLIDSPGMHNWKTPTENLYAGNSGTTARLMLGILSGSNISSVLTGDASLSVSSNEQSDNSTTVNGSISYGRIEWKSSSINYYWDIT